MKRIWLLLVLTVFLQSAVGAGREVHGRIFGEKTRVLLHQVDSLLLSRKFKGDTAYIARPNHPWLLMFSTSLRTTVADFHDRDQESPDYMERMLLHTPYEPSVGLKVSYRGLGVGLSLNPRKLFDKYAATEFDFNFYQPRFGIDLTYQDLRLWDGRLSLTNKQDPGQNISHALRKNGLQLNSVSANAYYVFNHRHFSYAAAFSHSMLQKRSAGSFLLAGGFYTGKIAADRDAMPYFEENEDGVVQYRCTMGELSPEELERMSYQQITFMRTRFLTFGAGYAYNFVLGRHRNWLLHVSAQPSYMIWKRIVMSIDIHDAETGITENVDEYLKPAFPEFFAIGRLAASYSWKNYFLGAWTVVQTAKAGQDRQMSFQQSKFKARLLFGVRL